MSEVHKINRVYHELMRGVPEHRLDAEKLRVTPDELPSLMVKARAEVVATHKRTKAHGRDSSLITIAAGLALLGLAYFVLQDEVPFMRQGRVVLATVFGVGCLGYGVVNFIEWARRQ